MSVQAVFPITMHRWSIPPTLVGGYTWRYHHSVCVYVVILSRIDEVYPPLVRGNMSCLAQDASYRLRFAPHLRNLFKICSPPFYHIFY